MGDRSFRKQYRSIHRDMQVRTRTAIHHDLRDGGGRGNSSSGTSRCSLSSFELVHPSSVKTSKVYPRHLITIHCSRTQHTGLSSTSTHLKRRRTYIDVLYPKSLALRDALREKSSRTRSH